MGRRYLINCSLQLGATKLPASIGANHDSLVIREIEEVDRNWEPNARCKKGRRELKPESDKLAETDVVTKANVDNQSTKKIPMDAVTDGGHCGTTDRPQEVTSPKRPRDFY